MEHLDTIIALSFILLIIAQCVSLLTDIINSGEKRRRKHFEIWENAGKNRVTGLLNQMDGGQANSNQLVESSFKSFTDISKSTANPHVPRREFSQFLVANLASTMSKPNLLRAAPAIEGLLKQLDDETTESFKHNARIKCTLLSIAIAMLLQLNIFSMLEELSTDPVATKRFVEQQLEFALAEKQAAPIEQQTELQQKIDGLETSLRALPNTTNSLYRLPGEHLDWTMSIFIGCLITGLLAGLGAPFWREQLTLLKGLRNSRNNSEPPLPSMEPPTQPDKTAKIKYPSLTLYSDTSSSLELENISIDSTDGIAETELRINGSVPALYTSPDELKQDILQTLKNRLHVNVTNVLLKVRPEDPQMKYFRQN
ncbi:hypothetical protein AltI4_08720 [Alteromonas sp. I4]|nr:hypothetical protein AltI4_08720 [Alteromonas sp. I4]